MWFKRPVPFVSVRNSVLNPISPLEGRRNSILTLPWPLFCIFCILPLLMPTFCVTTPINSSGQSIISCSMGSCSAPSNFFVMVSGIKLITLAPHHLYDNCKLKLAPPHYLKRIAGVCWFKTYGHIVEELLFKPLL